MQKNISCKLDYFLLLFLPLLRISLLLSEISHSFITSYQTAAVGFMVASDKVKYCCLYMLHSPECYNHHVLSGWNHVLPETYYYSMNSAAATRKSYEWAAV